MGTIRLLVAGHQLSLGVGEAEAIGVASTTQGSLRSYDDQESWREALDESLSAGRPACVWVLTNRGWVARAAILSGRAAKGEGG